LFSKIHDSVSYVLNLNFMLRVTNIFILYNAVNMVSQTEQKIE
jgi:hypothetical protein